MMNIELILDRIKNIKGLSKKKEIANLLGISATNFSNYLKRGTLAPIIFNWGVDEGISIDWLLTGEGQPLLSSQPDKSTTPIYKDGATPDDWDSTSLDAAVGKLHKIYSAGDPELVRAINANLDAFTHTVDLAGQVARLDDQQKAQAKIQKNQADRIARLEKLIKKHGDIDGCCLDASAPYEAAEPVDRGK